MSTPNRRLRSVDTESIPRRTYDAGTNLMVPSLNINHVLPGQDKTLSPYLQ